MEKFSFGRKLVLTRRGWRRETWLGRLRPVLSRLSRKDRVVVVATYPESGVITVATQRWSWRRLRWETIR